MGWLKDQYQELRGHAKWDLLKALMFTVLYPLLQKARHLSWDWWVFGGLFIVSFAVLVLFERQKRPQSQLSQTAQGKIDPLIPATSAIIPGLDPTFDAKTFFRTAYYSTVTAEVEKNIRIIANQNQPDDREGFFARFIGVGAVAYLNDITWYTIFKSQALMLSDMNSKNGWMPLAEAKGYYDKASTDYSKMYSNYSFEQWVGYMKQQQLILQHPSDMLEITIRGKDFLKYLTHWGRSFDSHVG